MQRMLTGETVCKCCNGLTVYILIPAMTARYQCLFSTVHHHALVDINKSLQKPPIDCPLISDNHHQDGRPVSSESVPEEIGHAL